jgi:hypothetical protein
MATIGNSDGKCSPGPIDASAAQRPDGTIIRRNSGKRIEMKRDLIAVGQTPAPVVLCRSHHTVRSSVPGHLLAMKRLQFGLSDRVGSQRFEDDHMIKIVFCRWVDRPNNSAESEGPLWSDRGAVDREQGRGPTEPLA